MASCVSHYSFNILTICYILSLLSPILTVHGFYFPISTKLEQCCSDPVNAFIMKEFSGACACMTLEQKWKRYADWVEIEGGYINPWIEFGYVKRYQDINSNQNSLTTSKSKTKFKKHKNEDFKMHSHERGVFAHIKQKYRRKIDSKSLLMQIPFSISFSQFLISKYIKNTKSIPQSKNPPIKDVLFPAPNHFMPDDFPDWDEYHYKTKRLYGVQSIRGWLALGLAWLREYTYELLPWLELLPVPHYLPITWDKFVRDEFLLTNTRALKIVNQLEHEFSTAKPYIKMLGLTEVKLKEAFAWITSRSFGMSLNLIGGHQRSPVIPCGIDFFNHNIFADSSLYYDTSFGQNRFLYNGNMQNQQVIENLIFNNKLDDMVREIDFASNFLWVNSDIINKSQIYVNYGKYHTSASRLALFGFIDAIHPYDHLNIQLNLLKNDLNYWKKYSYFKTVWNETYTQINKTKQYIPQYCYTNKMDMKSWYGIGKQIQKYQNFKDNKKKEQRIFGPPLSMEFYGQKTIKVHGNFLRFLRLAYLPKQYFDSFTISSILNDFEYDYLESIIDPLILVVLNSICTDLLNKYPTNLIQDEIQLKQIEYERHIILMKLKANMNKNMTETNRLTEIISNLDRNSVVLQYRIREKGFLDKCSKMKFEPTTKYLKTVNRKKYKYKMNQLRQKKKNFISNGSELEELLRTTFDFSNILSLNNNPRNGNINSNNISNVNNSNNISEFETAELDINYVELLKQIEDMLLDNEIDAEIFNIEFDETVWNNIVNDATQNLINDNQNIENDNDDDMLDNSEHIGGECDNEIINNSPTVVSKKNLLIGKPKKGKLTPTVQTIGWNSPRSGLSGAVQQQGAQVQQQQQTFTFMNVNGQPLDLSSLFGGGDGGGGGSGNTVTFNGNVQINNGRIIIGGGNNNNNNNQQQQMNNLLSQFGINMNIENNANDDSGNDNAIVENVNVNGHDNNVEIPETVPFSQVMNSATMSVFGLDGNGNLVSVGNSMNTNNINLDLAQLFGNRKKKNQRKPNP